MTSNRREFLRQTGLGLIAVQVAGAVTFLTPAQAHAASEHRFAVLDKTEQATLAALGEVLLPGCVEEGFCEFIDYHLSVPAEECLLMLRYLDVPAPYAGFYKACLANLDGMARSTHDQSFATLDGAAQKALVQQISHAQPEQWRGPPAPLFYFTVRSDAVDVYYGTQEGFARLDIPYMAHIIPTQPW